MAAAKEVMSSLKEDEDQQAVQNVDDQKTSTVYETEASLNMYLGLHYSQSGISEGMTPMIDHSHAPLHALRFPQRVAEILVSLQLQSTKCALDIGCAVGGASFELAKTFDHVDAFDYSESFIQVAQRMRAMEDVRFRIPVEADVGVEVQAMHEVDISPDLLTKVNFFTGDACQMDRMVLDGLLQYDNYDGVILSNLLCRLPDPIACLDTLPRIVKDNGVVVIVTPFSWLEEFTPRSKWLGGFYQQDPSTKEPVRSKEVLQHLMEERGFENIHEEEMALVIREHQRKYQYIVSEATAWRKLSR